jgi:hypothetical protein
MAKEPLLPRSSQALSQGAAQSGAQAGSQAGQARPAQSLAIKYVDLPELPETFADSVNSVSFDGQTLRVEFGVTRYDHASEQRPTSGRRYSASRLVLTRGAAVEMINRLRQVATAITQSGQSKPDAPKPATGTAAERTR